MTPTITTKCVICGTRFEYPANKNSPRKTCGPVCRSELQRRCGANQFEQTEEDPSPDEIARRAAIIREINEDNKRKELGRPRIHKYQLDWLK